jgi:uncharacterized protein YgbK (DUF1537 family)
MFLVIADDLTGAAEIGGVAWRHGLTAEVQLGAFAGSSADVIIVDMDTRSLPACESARRVGAIVRTCPGGVGRIFKKVDSVLRGPVVAELRALLEATGLPRALLVPSNPSLGRTVARGRYWIDGVPIHETDFSRDPEHPVESPLVVEMLHAPEVEVLPIQSDVPRAGIFVGEAAGEPDVATWASRLDDQTLPAGAASFFSAILERDGFPSRSRPKQQRSGKILLVAGSASEYSRRQLEEMSARGVSIVTMPASSESVARAFHTSRLVAVAGRGSVQLVELVEQVLDKVRIAQLWIEGGATASAVIRYFGWKRLDVQEELSPGVVSIQPRAAGAPSIVLKPGSYRWAAID